MKNARQVAGAVGWIKNFVGTQILILRAAACNFRDRLCRFVCGDRLFNSDMSLEIDRLTAEVDRLRDELGDG